MEEFTHKYFDIKNKNDKFPNMNVVLRAKEITKLNYPAIVHVDGSSRIQTLNIVNNKKFYELISHFNEKFSCPMLLNTSLNIDEPICENPQDVISSFAQTKVDCIIMQNYSLIKKI